MTTQVITIIISILTGVIIIAQLVRMDRNSGRASGRRDEVVKQHTAQVAQVMVSLNNHGQRISTLETTRFMTFADHDSASKKCRDEVDRRLDHGEKIVGDIFKVISDGEEKRERYREEDNKWRIDVTRSLEQIRK